MVLGGEWAKHLGVEAGWVTVKPVTHCNTMSCHASRNALLGRRVGRLIRRCAILGCHHPAGLVVSFWSREGGGLGSTKGMVFLGQKVIKKVLVLHSSHLMCLRTKINISSECLWSLCGADKAMLLHS